MSTTISPAQSVLARMYGGVGKRVFGHWVGTEERPDQCTNQHVLSGFNVDFIDGMLCRRLGRQVLAAPVNVRPTIVLTNSLALSLTPDQTQALTDGDLATTVISSNITGLTTSLYVGFPFKVLGINISVSISNGSALGATAQVPISAYYYNRFPTTSALTAVRLGVINDTTSARNGTGSVFALVRSGTVSWSSTSISDWVAGSSDPYNFFTSPFAYTPISVVGGRELYFSGNAVASKWLPQDINNLYWIRLDLPPTVTGSWGISEISGTLQGLDVNFLQSVAAATEFTTRNKDRVLVAVSDFPSILNEATANQPPQTAVFTYNLDRGDISGIMLPYDTGAAAANASQRLSSNSFATFNGWLIGSSRDGYLWRYNGTTSARLEAVSGMDAQLGILGAKGYLPSAPRGVFLESYHNKLMVAGSPDSPLTFYASLVDNDIATVPPNAPVGGPNVWPIDGVFNVPGKEGDYITGAAVVNDRYTIFTRSQTWVFDEFSLKLTNGDIGCIAPGSIQKINNAIYFLSDTGIFVSDSVNAQKISDPIFVTLRDLVNWAAVPSSCVSAHYKAKGEYWLWVPIRSEPQTQIAIVFNYIKNYWRVVGGWYPFDYVTRRSSNYHNVTASIGSKDYDGRSALLTIDGNGRLIQENVGYDDAGFVFPAYAILNTQSNQGDVGEDYSKFREWYINIEMDGSWIEAISLEDGEKLPQEIDRRFHALPINSESAQKQALVQNSVSNNTSEVTYTTASAWSTFTHFPQQKKLKLSFGRNVSKTQPVLHWPGGQYVASNGSYGPLALVSGQELYYGAASYLNGLTPTRGGVMDVQIATVPKASGR